MVAEVSSWLDLDQPQQIRSRYILQTREPDIERS